MIDSERLRTVLYWFLLLQCCIISVSIAAASICLALSIGVILVLIVKEKKWIVPRTPLDYAFAAYIVIELITALTSVSQADAFRNAKRLLLIAIVYGVIAAFNSRKKAEKAVMVLTGTVAILSAAEVSIFLYGGSDRLYVFQHYMTTGGLKMIVSLMVLPYVLSRENNLRVRIAYAAALIPMVTALMLTNTRSSWLGFIAGIVVMSGLYYRRLFALLIAGIILFFLFAPQHQIDRAKSIVDLSHPNNIGRLTMWSTGLQMWKDKPVFGYGDIDLLASYSQYRTPGIEEPAGHMHNNYIHLLVTLGAAGFIVVMVLFSMIIVQEVKVFRTYANDPLIRNIALGGISVFTGFLINGLFEWNFGDHEIMVFVWFTAGLVIASQRYGEVHQ